MSSLENVLHKKLYLSSILSMKCPLYKMSPEKCPYLKKFQ